MRIGVICEGPTDYPAITHFFGGALRASGVEATFKSLHPTLDRTRPTGGWGNVLLWLAAHGPQERVRRFFGGGLFDEPLDEETFDVLLVQLDTDVVDEESFRTYVQSSFGFEVSSTPDPVARADQVRMVLEIALKFNELSLQDARQHVICPAVDSTESWCVAAFDRRQAHTESLQGNELTSAFMKALERSEGKTPEDNYANCNKDRQRREKYCSSHGRFWGRVVRSCPHFAITLDHLKAVNE